MMNTRIQVPNLRPLLSLSRLKKTAVLLLGAWLMMVASEARPSYFPAHTAYQACFTPLQNCQRLLVQEIRQARQDIYIQSYTFTSYSIAKALVQAQKRGVKIMLILDKSQFQSGNNTITRYLLRHGIAIWQDGSLNIAHNKVMIFDQRAVETGSFNYTNSAQKYNAENMLIIESRELAAQYLANWRCRQVASRRM